ncbi:uncharacterized protein V1518DRAFT_417564 [Limtongia smithiae]|uniref:uncharacterized protein n=1 Tax=Limtongia smithiae TaxID=1125753 RepID=UPI0034CE2289
MAKAGVVNLGSLVLQNPVYRISGIILITWALLHFIFGAGRGDGGMSNEQAQAKARAALQRKIDQAELGQDGFKRGPVDYFADFYGAQECEINSQRLYNPMMKPDGSLVRPYCENKARLLDALSGGGRIGFNSPYHPLDCEYRWFSPEEVCMILDRFDALIFIGDARSSSHIYGAFNSILRKNVAWGALKNWELNDQLRRRCRCEFQYTNAQCSGGGTGVVDHMIVDSTEILGAKEDATKTGAPYACNRIFHGLLDVSAEPVPSSTLEELDELFVTYHKTAKPVPIIFQQGLSHGFNWDKTTKVMDVILEQANKHEPNPNHRPILWIGASSAGHLKPPGAIIEQGNNALYHFNVEMTKRAHDRGFDVLNLYNLTLQADSYDGTRYGQDVSLVSAMMVINWLSRIETL